MKRFLGVIFVLVCFITPAFAEPVSQEVLNQARTQAGLFMDLKNALGLEWLDEYNIYLTDPTGNPAPSWASSVDELINKNYLSVAFPTDFTISPAGKEVTISRTITNQGVKNALPIYLPAVTISGDTVSLLVQRPAQWVAWEDALASKVSRAGDDNPDILPGASLEFGSGSKIEFINNDGKLVGINSLTYKGQELEDRFVNAAGDNMTGPLKINGNIVWHAGNDGSGSGLDADLLDGKDSSHFTNASNLISGTVPTGRLTGTYNISISGNAATATNANYASSAGNADTVDGKHASDFALSGHTHGQYVQKTGDTMTGTLAFNKTLSSANKLLDLQQGYAVYSDNTGGSNGTRLWIDAPNGGEVVIGPRAGANFLNDIRLRSQVISLETNGNQNGVTVNGNAVWHAGNDGTGSGLDADLFDSKDSSFFTNASNLSSGIVPVARLSGTYNISISGNAETLDGYNHDAFVKRAGDTMAGILTAPGFQLNDANTKLAEGAGNSVRVQTNYGYVDIGPTNSGWAHFNTDRASFYFNKPVHATDKLQIYNTNTYLTGTEGKIAGNKIWHAGNDGSGSGLDADLLDGKHLSEILSEIGGIWDVIIEDRKPQGTHGGNFESGAWRTRDLNTLVFNHNSLASLGGNRFTLPAGTYCIDWDAPAAGVGAHKSALYNYTTSTIVAYGTSAYDFNNTVGTTVITITSPTSFEIRHICEKSRHTLGFGMATNFGTEIYTRVCIKKIG